MKLTMFCNGQDEPENNSQCCSSPDSSDHHHHHYSMNIDDVDPGLAYATIAPHVLVLETNEHEQDMGISINGINIAAPATAPPFSSNEPNMQTPLTPLSPNQQEQEAANMLISMFPNPPLASMAQAGLMHLDDEGHENEFILMGGNQGGTQNHTNGHNTDHASGHHGYPEGRSHSNNKEHSDQAQHPGNGQGTFVPSANPVRRTTHIKMDLIVTTTTRKAD